MSTALTPAPVLPLPAWRYLAPIGLAYAAKRGFDVAAVSFDAAWAEVRRKWTGRRGAARRPQGDGVRPFESYRPWAIASKRACSQRLKCEVRRMGARSLPHQA